MINIPMPVIEEVALRNCHVREMLELKRVAARYNVTNQRCESCLQSWTAEWLENNPRQAALILSRFSIEVL